MLQLRRVARRCRSRHVPLSCRGESARRSNIPVPAMPTLAALRRDWFSNVRADLLAGLVVALALIPEAIGFSIIAGVDPRVGLYASFSIAVIIAFVGGRPGMISAATRRCRGSGGPAGARAWPRLSVRRDHPDGRAADRRRLSQIPAADAVRVALCRHRLRQCARHPDFHGAAAAADRRSAGTPMRWWPQGWR